MVWLFSAGVVAGVFHSIPFLLLILAIVLARAVLLRAGHAWVTVALSLACGAIGWSAMERSHGDRGVVTRAAARARGQPLPLRGWVASFPQSGRYGVTFAFATHVDGHPVRISVRAGRFDIGYGDSLAIDLRLATASRTPEAFLVARGVAGEGRARFLDVRRLHAAGGCPVLRGVLWPLHRVARTRLARALGNDAALPVGLLLGERAMLDRAAYDAVRALGIAHLLALSGMHLTMIAALAVFATRRAVRRRDAWVAVALSLYVGVVGDVDSLTRAYLMALVILTARALVRPPRPIDALGKALLIMLLIDPCAILSVGLQLSFVATLAVLICIARLPASLVRPPARGLPAWRRVLARAGQGAAAAFAISLVVEAFIAPLQLHHFGRMSVVGPVATVVFMLPVSMLQIMALLASFGVPAIDAPLASALAWGSVATRDGIVAAGGLAPAPVGIPVPNWTLYYMALWAVCVLHRHRWVWWAGAAGIGLSFWLG